MSFLSANAGKRCGGGEERGGDTAKNLITIVKSPSNLEINLNQI